MCQSLFFNKVEKETLAQVFSCKFCEMFRNTSFHRRPPVTAPTVFLAGSSYLSMLDLFKILIKMLYMKSFTYLHPE